MDMNNIKPIPNCPVSQYDPGAQNHGPVLVDVR